MRPLLFNRTRAAAHALIGSATCFALIAIMSDLAPGLGATSADIPELNDCVRRSALIVVARFAYAHNRLHEPAELTAPMVLYGQLDTNTQLSATFPVAARFAFVEPEAVWVFFLGEAYRRGERRQYRDVVRDRGGVLGILEGTQENIRQVKQLVLQRRMAEPKAAGRDVALSTRSLVARISNPQQNKEEVMAAIGELRRRGPGAADAAPALARLADDPDLGPAAAQGLCEIGGAAIPFLVAELTNRNQFVRLICAGCLGKMAQDAGPAAVAGLVSSLGDSFEEVRIAAASAVGKIRSAPELAVPALIRGLDDQSLAVRCEAARALARFGSDARRALPALNRRAARETNAAFSDAIHWIESGSWRD